MSRKDTLVRRAMARAGEAITDSMTVEQKADALEDALSAELDVMIVPPGALADPQFPIPPDEFPKGHVQMHSEPRLPKMPEKPTLVDFFKLRWAPASHVLQSAALARRNGYGDRIVMACLLHDISVHGLIRTDHGYWTAQLVEPYVHPEVAFAIRYHQALRFFPDPDAGYEYPVNYLKWFGEDYVPPDYIKADYEYARAHEWYMSARQVTLNDLYAFDPAVNPKIEEFEDIIAREFRQPEEGL
ncbi:MAG: hypothetical protein IIC03_14265, partial [Proteobacteria bacterium]|nr:hypothetical protein [Pseudomonadota bacterium]